MKNLRILWVAEIKSIITGEWVASYLVRGTRKEADKLAKDTLGKLGYRPRLRKYIPA